MKYFTNGFYPPSSLDFFRQTYLEIGIKRCKCFPFESLCIEVANSRRDCIKLQSLRHCNQELKLSHCIATMQQKTFSCDSSFLNKFLQFGNSLCFIYDSPSGGSI